MWTRQTKTEKRIEFEANWVFRVRALVGTRVATTGAWQTSGVETATAGPSSGRFARVGGGELC